MSETPKPVRGIVAWVTLGLVVAGLGAFAVNYFNQYASATEVRDISTKLGTQHEEFQQHVLDEKSERSALKQAVDDLHADYKFTLDQLREIAKTTRARVIPLPAHEQKNGEE